VEKFNEFTTVSDGIPPGISKIRKIKAPIEFHPAAGGIQRAICCAVLLLLLCHSFRRVTGSEVIPCTGISQEVSFFNVSPCGNYLNKISQTHIAYFS
jgi:hypothetical protein